MAKRKLGRGLDTLIARGEAPEPDVPSGGVLHLSPAEISVNPQQPRQRFSIAELESLKASISKEGILQPLLVRKLDQGYQLVAGERRLRAAKELALDKVPVLPVTLADDRLLEVALVENIHRENLNPVELAQAYRNLMSLKGWTQEELAEELGVSRPAVSNTVRLLELSEDMQNALVRGQISMGHAKVLLSVADPKLRRVLFDRIGDEKLSVRELELVRSGDEEPDSGSGGDKKPTSRGRRKRRGGGEDSKRPYIQSLEDELTEALGTRVRIREKGGKGLVSVEFYSKEDFERLRSLLLGQVRA